jgi:hypothetical protein
MADFRFRILKNGLYQVHTKVKGAYEGGAASVVNKAIELGIRKKDLQHALTRLLDNPDHDYADFEARGYYTGIYKDSK